MGSSVDYDIHDAKGPGQCGEPFDARPTWAIVKRTKRFLFATR